MKTSRTIRLCKRRTGSSGRGRAVMALAGLVPIAALPAPVRACDIVVGAGSTVTLNGNFTADCITVAGTLNIGGTLTLTGGGSSSVTGTVNLIGSGSELAFTTASHWVSGSGKIMGKHSSSKISVASGKTLTSTTNITGKLEIAGDGSFTNQGTVEANTNGTLKLAVGGTLNDNSGDLWIVSANGAKLQFDSSLGTVNTLAGNFVMTSGNSGSKIIFDHPVTTNGRLQMSVGVVEVNQDVTMDADSAISADALDMRGGDILVAANTTFTHH